MGGQRNHAREGTTVQGRESEQRLWRAVKERESWKKIVIKVDLKEKRLWAWQRSATQFHHRRLHDKSCEESTEIKVYR